VEVPRTSDFAQRLRGLREKAGLSQYALAGLAGISKQAMNHLEAGRNEPGWETVQRLALALGVTCEAFVDPGLSLPGVEPARMGRPKAVKKPPKKRGRPRKGP
jgi:transcriptional regulator with XRE-family HTH domain